MQEQQPSANRRFNIRLSLDSLNFILALSAILVSIASFYATYLQANSAEQQVKAMTWPLIQFEHGNFDDDTREVKLQMLIKNAGVGPAIVKNVSFIYKGQTYNSVGAFFNACCEATKTAFYQSESLSENKDDEVISSQLNNVVLPSMGKVMVMSLKHSPRNQAFWEEIDNARWDLNLEICYCSLLENCYVTQESGTATEVKACPNPNGG